MFVCACCVCVGVHALVRACMGAHPLACVCFLPPASDSLLMPVCV